VSRAFRAVQSSCDGWLWWAYYPAAVALLAAMTLFTRWYAGKVADDWEQWVVADWLVTYAPGFVRRGLSGQLLFAVSEAFSTPANTVVRWAIVAVYLVFAVAMAVLLWRKRLTFWWLVLALSPASVPFSLYNPAAVGRKEGLLVAAFAVWALWLGRRPLSPMTGALFGLAAVALTLMHEVFAFYAPYFVLVAYLTEARHEDGRAWRWSALVPAGALVGLAAVLASTATLDDPTLCARLVGAGAPMRVCEGLFDYQQAPAASALAAGLSLPPRALGMAAAAAAAIVLLPLWCFALANVEAAAHRRVLLGGCAFAMIWSAPLFLVAVDWGRWIAIHAVLTTVLCAALLPQRARPPALRAGLRPLAAAVAGALLLASMLLWSPKYCCREDLFTDYTPVEAVQGTWADFEL
jgi:hypothetical protein